MNNNTVQSPQNSLIVSKKEFLPRKTLTNGFLYNQPSGPKSEWGRFNPPFLQRLLGGERVVISISRRQAGPLFSKASSTGAGLPS